VADFTQEQLDALNAAIAAGVLEVRYADKTVRYADMNAMLRARALMKKEIAGTERTTRLFHKTSKGL
jgi:hypothetical protein